MFENVITVDDVFLIPVGKYAKVKDDACYLVYSPFARRMALIARSSEAFQLMINDSVVPNKLAPLFSFDKRELLSYAPSTPEQLRRMSILPNEKCNFRCSYCYAAQGRSNVELDSTVINRAIQWFVSRKRCGGQDLFISILGGGEPLLSWGSTKQAILFIRYLERQENLKVALAITTNASLITDEIATFLNQQRILVNASFDVLEDVQNTQRGYFKEVEAGIFALARANVQVVFRSTITPLNVHRCLEMAHTCVSRYPFVKGLSLEAVAAGREIFPTKKYLYDFLRTFHKSFYEAYQYGRTANLKVSTSSFLNMDILSDRFCSGDFCLTPSGELSICHRISSPKEKNFKRFVFGEVSGSGVTINDSAFERLSRMGNASRERCKSCFMRWHCGGMCLGKEIAFPEEYLDVLCDAYCCFGLEHLINIYSHNLTSSFSNAISKTLETSCLKG